MRPPGTRSDDRPATTTDEADPRPIDGSTLKAALDSLRRDLVSGTVPDDELLRRVEAFADLFIATDPTCPE